MYFQSRCDSSSSPAESSGPQAPQGFSVVHQRNIIVGVLYVSFYIADQRMVTSVTNCPVAEVPAPPAVKPMAPAVLRVPANAPALPGAVETVLL